MPIFFVERHTVLVTIYKACFWIHVIVLLKNLYLVSEDQFFHITYWFDFFKHNYQKQLTAHSNSFITTSSKNAMIKQTMFINIFLMYSTCTLFEFYIQQWYPLFVIFCQLGNRRTFVYPFENEMFSIPFTYLWNYKPTLNVRKCKMWTL